LLIGGILILACALLLTAFAPLLISNGIRLWFWWKTRNTNVTAKIDGIDAPFLRPITLRGVRIQTTAPAAARIDLTAARVIFGLNLKSILLRTRGRTLQNLLVQGLHAEIRVNQGGVAISENEWNTVQRLLPASFDLQSVDLRLETQSGLALLRNVSISGTPIETGRFEAGEIVISSPMFRQTFSNLRGATEWQGERLTIAALTLTRGLDVQSITTDLSHVGKRRVALEFEVDAFGGKLRGSLADEWRSGRSNWNIAGSAADISLAQTTEAFGFTNRVGGLLHAGKFTFRGDLSDALAGTASLWLELTAPAWRDREADVVMAGLSLYGGQIELQQLYIKQKKNELTLNGESSFPTTPAGWLRPDFRGNVSASIDDLGDFASFLGANRQDFAGRIEVEGTFNARDKNVGGNLVASGSGLTMFKNTIDRFQATLNVKHDEIEISEMEFLRKNDMIRAQGKIDTSAQHDYSGSMDATIEDITAYLPHGQEEKTAPVSASIHGDVTAAVWEVQATFNPPDSMPVNITATFPLPVGRPLAAIWSSPVSLSADLPALELSEMPTSLWPARFGTGMLIGQITIADSLLHPRMTGYLNLSDIRLGSTPIGGRLRFEGDRAIVETLTVGDPVSAVLFGGDIDLHDTERIGIHLIPNQHLVDLSAPLLECVDRVEVGPNESSSDDTTIGRVDITGGIGRSDWHIMLSESPFGALLPGLDAVTSKTFRFCPGDNPSGPPLALGFEAPQPAPSLSPTPAVRQRKKKG